MINNPVTPFENAEELSPGRNQTQLERILRSNTLRNSPTLQQLLLFLVSRAMEGNPEGLKEYTIGVEAFGRRPDFDPKTDTIVRVQTHRLRQKLKEYYEHEGLHDQILIEIPKGHYYPTFQPRTEIVSERDLESNAADAIADLEKKAAGNSAVDGLKSQPEATLPNSWPRYLYRILAGLAILAAALLLGFLVGRSHTSTETSNSGYPSRPSRFGAPAPDPVKSFWASFLNNDPSPIIAYPNAVFLLDDSNDLFRFRQGASDNRGARVNAHLAQEFAANPSVVASAGQLYYEDGYTGTGELEGVAMLAALFTEMGAKPIVKTSRNITPEDLQQHAVILLGSPFQNIAVTQLLAAGDFTFQNPDSHREQWRAQIVDSHPSGEEIPIYRTERDPVTQVLKKDYSLVSIQPGVVEGHHIAILGGLDTKGTEGVTRFMTSRAGIEQLSAALAARHLNVAGSEKGRTPWFQALIVVHLEKGDQVLSTELNALHPLTLRSSPPIDPQAATPPTK